jgi:hypothetical protein
MKLAFVLAILSSFIGTAAYAEDPLPIEEPSTNDQRTDDDPGTPNENDNAPPITRPSESPSPAPTPAPEKAKPRARLSNSPSPRTVRPFIKDDGESRLEKTEDEVEGGKHWRIKTAQGAVHVWVPPGYDRANAGTVVYVHGYWTDADGAWREHQLAKQFKLSRQNAIFIVPDAPRDNSQGVHWPALTDLRKAVMRGNIHLPDGPIVVMGHSGAFRTVMQWIDHKLVDQIILLDAMYGGQTAFDEFIASGKRADDHKLIIIGSDVAYNSATFTSRYKFGKAREKVPETMSGFTKAERRSKLLYIHSQYDHYSMITNKKVIPLLLKVTRLKAL